MTHCFSLLLDPQLIHRRGFFTPMDKFGPLSFFKLTHEAFRGAVPRLEKAVAAIDLVNKPEQGQRQLEDFAANYNLFVQLHIEHARHEDEVVFKEFNNFFPHHADTSTEEHEHDRVVMERLRTETNKALDVDRDMQERQASLAILQADLPPFLKSFLDHIRYEEDNLQPIGRKYMNLDLQKNMARTCFLLTPAAKWEDLLPYIILSMPRHMQRVRYLKALMWSMPERAQQVGAIVYRNVDAVMWERLRVELPEMIPRGERNWRRYW